MESRLLEQPEEFVGFRDRDFQSLLGLLARLVLSGERAFVALVCYILLILLPQRMTASSYSHIVKLNWAGVHLRFLQERVQAFIDSKPHEVEPQLDPDTGEIVIYGEALREPPMQEWGVIIGDIVHNLRSALDHLVWALTLAHQSYPPPTPIPKKGWGHEWRETGFPIYTDPYPPDHLGNLIPWATSKEPKSLWGIDPSLRADFQGLQPFNHGKDAPFQPLAVLNELWNIDKHRHLHLTNFYVILNDIIRHSTPEKHLLWAKLEAPRPFKERTELGRVRKLGGGTVPLTEMDVNPTLFSDVAFPEGPPAYRARLMQTLEGFHDTVAAILVKFQPHLP